VSAKAYALPHQPAWAPLECRRPPEVRASTPAGRWAGLGSPASLPWFPRDLGGFSQGNMTVGRIMRVLAVLAPRSPLIAVRNSRASHGLARFFPPMPRPFHERACWEGRQKAAIDGFFCWKGALAWRVRRDIGWGDRIWDADYLSKSPEEGWPCSPLPERRLAPVGRTGLSHRGQTVIGRTMQRAARAFRFSPSTHGRKP
jgi:hypothetical protein